MQGGPRKNQYLTASFAKHLKYQKIMNFSHAPWVNSGRSK